MQSAHLSWKRKKLSKEPYYTSFPHMSDTLWSKYNRDQSLKQEFFRPGWTRFKQPCSEWEVSVSVTLNASDCKNANKCKFSPRRSLPQGVPICLRLSWQLVSVCLGRIQYGCKREHSGTHIYFLTRESDPEGEDLKTSPGSNMEFLNGELLTLCHLDFFILWAKILLALVTVSV